MRKLAITLVTIVFATSLSALPAQASVPVNGTYDCETGVKFSDAPPSWDSPGFVMTDGVVSGGIFCMHKTQLTIPDGTTEIGDFGLPGLYNLTTITIPNTVVRIGERAFMDCRVSSIVIPASVKYIAAQAFYLCRNLDNFTFEAGSQIISIGDQAFENTPLAHLTLPASLRNFGIQNKESDLASITFEPGSLLESFTSLVRTPTLTSIQFGAGGTFRNDQDGLVYNSSLTQLLWYPRLRTGSFSIPASVTSIGESAFRQTLITDIFIPQRVQSIGNRAFENTEQLTSVSFAPGIQLRSIEENTFSYSNLASITIPASVVDIREEAFSDTDELTIIRFAEGSQLETIEEYAFYYSGVTSLEFPASLLTISDDAFSSCENLTTIIFSPDSRLETIGDGAFEYTSIAAFTIPRTVSEIGSSALNTAVLSSISVVEPNPWYTTDDGVLFDESKTTLLQYPSQKTDKYYSIPPTVQTVLYSAFGGNPFLTSVSIPASVGEIQSGAFGGTTALSNVAIAPNSTLTHIPAGVFFNTPSLKSFTMPASVTDVHTYSFYGSGVTRMTFLGNQFYWMVYNEADPLTFQGVSDEGQICIDASKEWDQIYKDLFTCEHTLSFDSNGGSPVSIELFSFSTIEFDGPEGEEPADQNQLAVIPEPSTPIKQGYSFDGWSASNGGAILEFPYSLRVVGDFALYANWTPLSDAPDDSSGSPQAPSPQTSSPQSTTTQPASRVRVIASVTQGQASAEAEEDPLGNATESTPIAKATDSPNSNLVFVVILGLIAATFLIRFGVNRLRRIQIKRTSNSK